MGPGALAGLALPALALTGRMVLASRQWLAGLVAVAVGVPAAVAVSRALYALTLRWVVMVPAGLVVKDHLALGEAVLFRRTDITSLTPAAADTGATDLTSGAFGLALEVRLRAPVELPLVTGRNQTTIMSIDALLVTPTRPGAVL